MPPEKNDYYYEESDRLRVQALLLAKVVERILRKKGELSLSSKPALTLRPIIPFMKKMRVSGLEKFSEKTYISVVNYYRNNKEFTKQQACGALVFYVPSEFVGRLARALDYVIADELDANELMDVCGTFCNLVGGNFKNGLSQLGFQDIIMSPFTNFENSVVDGVDYDPRETSLFEVSFEIEGVKTLVFDLTLGHIDNENEVKQFSYFK